MLRVTVTMNTPYLVLDAYILHRSVTTKIFNKNFTPPSSQPSDLNICN